MPSGKQVVYVVIMDAAGRMTAQRYLERDRLEAWLLQNVDGGAITCDVYDKSPSHGGTILESLRRVSGAGWTATQRE